MRTDLGRWTFRRMNLEAEFAVSCLHDDDDFMDSRVNWLTLISTSTQGTVTGFACSLSCHV